MHSLKAGLEDKFDPIVYPELKYHEEYKSIASNQYKALKKEFKDLKHDFHGTRYFPDCDPMLQRAVSKIREDELARKTVKGPSAIKNRFTSKYWREWNNELSLLQDLSAKDIQDAREKKPQKKHPKPKFIQRGTAAVFSGPIQTRPAHFDGHILGTQHVTTLTKECLHWDKPIVHPSITGVYDPEMIGLAKIKGGAFSLGATRSVPHSETALCDMPPVDKPKSFTGMKFTSSTRFDADRPKLGSSAAPPPSSTSALRNCTDELAGGRFSDTSRFSNTNSGLVETPGPGHYKVSRMFDGQTVDSEKLEQLLETLHKKNDLMGKTEIDYTNAAVFGFGCDRQQHVLYGICDDKMCGKRAPWEKVIMATNSRARLMGGAESMEEREMVNTLASMTYCPTQELSPIYTAAFRGDVDGISRLKFRVDEVNIIEKATGYSPLHIGVIRCRPESVEALIDTFGKHLDMNIQDVNGDTPLHHASRSGFEEIVAILCDNGADPRKIKNYQDETAMDVSKSHKVYQIIKLTITQLDLDSELQTLHNPTQEIRQKVFLESMSAKKTTLKAGSSMKQTRFKADITANKVVRTHTYDSNTFPNIPDIEQQEDDDTGSNAPSESSNKSISFDRRKISTHTLKNPKYHSLLIGYWKDDAEGKPKQTTSMFHH